MKEMLSRTAGVPGITLRDRLVTARRRLAELDSQRVELTNTQREISAETAKAEARLKTEREDALMEDRKASPAIVKASADAREQLDTIRHHLETMEGAIGRQRTLFRELEDEIRATSRTMVLEAVGPKAERARQIIDELGRLALEIMRASTGEVLFPADLFGNAENQTLLDARVAVLNSALRLAEEKSLYGGSREVAA